MTSRLAGWVILGGCICLLASLGSTVTEAVEWEAALFQGGPYPGGMCPDCVLTAYDVCSGWIWVATDDPGAVWGLVLDPNDCPGGCQNGGAVCEVAFYGRCSSVPGAIGGIAVRTVDMRNCLVDLLYDSGPMTVTHCVSGDQWTVVPVPLIPALGNPFAITIEWGPDANPRLATDNAVANFLCAHGRPGVLGCATPENTCVGWVNRPELTYVYITDLDDDGTLEDVCALYGAPYFPTPYIYYYGYNNNNLIMVVGLDCSSPVAVEPTSWGRVKALFD